MVPEKDRLKFVEERDGLDAAILFAKQGMCVYIKAAMDSSRYKESLEEYSRFLRKHGYKPEIVINKDNNTKES